MEEFFDIIPKQLINFLIVLFLSLLIGLEQRFIHQESTEKPLFGTDRTFTFIGILGYILYILDPVGYLLFLTGAAALTIFLAIYYFYKARSEIYGLTSVFVAFITYALGPIVSTQPPWLVLLIFVSVLVLVELKPTFQELSEKFERLEFITLGKFLILIGIILPLVPDERMITFLPITPYQVWLAVVVISAISYLSYLLQKFVFKKAGIFITAILAGLYSSTAATFILSRKSNSRIESPRVYAAAIVFATAVMYIRLFILIAIFSLTVALNIAIQLFVLFLLSIVIGIIYFNVRDKDYSGKATGDQLKQNPLEIKIALLFAILYVVFNIVTYFAIEYYGTAGLNILSFVVGVTAIDPYLINLIQGGYNLSITEISRAALIAVASNNLMKTIYAGFLARGESRKFSVIGLSLIFVATIVAIYFV
jgi:uncharacterized membrane protein (DUF4010 family)